MTQTPDTSQVAAEGPDLYTTLVEAARLLQVDSFNEMTWEYDRPHFPAMTVRVYARPLSDEIRAARRAEQERMEAAIGWARAMLTNFGSDPFRVHGQFAGDKVVVSIETRDDGGLLIGKDGRNLGAFQVLFEEAMKKKLPGVEVILDIEGYLSRDRGRDDDRGPRRDRDDRGPRGRDRDDRGPRRDRDDRGPRRDRDDRGPRRDRGPGRLHDEARDEDLRKHAVAMAQKVLDGQEQSVRFPDLNSYERYIVHNALKDVDGVESRSVANGADKVVEVVPA